MTNVTHASRGYGGEAELSATSFPGSSLFLPRGRKREDPGNEVELSGVETHLRSSSKNSSDGYLRVGCRNDSGNLLPPKYFAVFFRNA